MPSNTAGPIGFGIPFGIIGLSVGIAYKIDKFLQTIIYYNYVNYIESENNFFAIFSQKYRYFQEVNKQQMKSIILQLNN